MTINSIFVKDLFLCDCLFDLFRFLFCVILPFTHHHCWYISPIWQFSFELSIDFINIAILVLSFVYPIDGWMHCMLQKKLAVFVSLIHPTIRRSNIVNLFLISADFLPLFTQLTVGSSAVCTAAQLRNSCRHNFSLQSCECLCSRWFSEFGNWCFFRASLLTWYLFNPFSAVIQILDSGFEKYFRKSS